MEERRKQILRRIQGNKGSKEREMERKTSKSKSRGHKKPWVNNVKNKPADSEEGWEYVMGK